MQGNRDDRCRGGILMNFETWIDLVQQYGYAALFVAVVIGITIAPVPNEAVIMSGGTLAASGVINPAFAYLITLAGVVTGRTIGYALGRLMGKPILARLMKKP